MSALTSIPAGLDISKAPRVWKPNASGVKVRCISPAWLRRKTLELQAREIAAAEVPPADRIIREVAQKHGVSEEALVSTVRSRRLSPARSEAMWRLCNEAGVTTRAVAVMFGLRHHTTVTYGRDEYQKRIDAGQVSP